MSDTERQVRQLDSDIHEIYGLTQSLNDRVRSLETMITRQGNRLNALEGYYHDLRADVTTLQQDVSEIRTVQSDHGHKLDQILELLGPR